MITVTDRAASELQQVLAAQGAPAEQGVKLVPNPTGGIAMVIAPPEEGDEVVSRDENPVLIVDRSIAQALDGTVLDVQPGEGTEQQGMRFTLERPGAES